MEVEDEEGFEEVVGGCLVQHGQVWNGDVKIHYVECGDKNGELVVLIHGFPNFWYVWKNQFLALAEAGYHVVAPDLRGYNTSSKPDGIQCYGRSAVVSDMVLLIDHLGNGKPATVVGHDWGGFVTWALAEDFPQKVKKAVLANVPHSSVFGSALRSSLRQIRRSWYIGIIPLMHPSSNQFFMRVVSTHFKFDAVTSRNIVQNGVCNDVPGLFFSITLCPSINYKNCQFSSNFYQFNNSIGWPTTLIKI
ncbi:hypothetical protein M758_10G081200 [Ceratodon purpureus]|nr:hypothetical protein M758_10G081200 [Ceratodon purpureus]